MSEQEIAIDEGFEDSGVVETGDTSEDYVPVEEADYEDLTAFLASGDPKEEAQPEQVATTEKKPDSGPEFVKAAELPESPVPQEDYEKLRTKFEQQELFLKRRSSEIGELRRQLKEAHTKLSEVLPDKWQESPQEAFQMQQKVNEIDKNLADLDAEEERTVTEIRGRQILETHLKPEERDIQPVLEMLAEDGMPEDFIRQFAENRLAVARPETIVHMHKRAAREKMLKQMIPAVQKLLAENQELKKLKGETTSRVAEKLQRELKRSPQMAASQPTSSVASDDVSAVDFSQMDEAQLNEFLRRK